MNILGGSNDGAGTAIEGFVCRGGRTLNEETYENFWELFNSIPSLRAIRNDCSFAIYGLSTLKFTHKVMIDIATIKEVFFVLS